MYLRGRISRLLLGVTVLFGVIGIGALITSHQVSATSGINEHINFQGRLFNSQGATVPDGNYNIQFKIYQDGAGTTAGNPGGTLLWTENWLNSGSHGVQVKNGYLSVELGTVTPFGSSIDWNQDTLWLSMNIGNGTSCTITTSFNADCGGDGEMVPMKRMSSTPYSLNSGKLGGLTSSQFLQLAQGVQTDASNVSSLFLNKTGTGNIVQLQSSSTDVFTVSNSGNLAFGANSDHNISVTTAAAGTGGKYLTVSAGAGGSGTGSTGGDLVLQGGAGGGTNGNGGNVVINAGAKTGAGTDGVISIGTSNTASITLGADTAISANKNISFAAGSGSFDQSASSGTFKTGTGAVSLNGDTTVTTGKNFSVTNGTSSLTGTTNVNTSGSANTNIGNGSTGTVTIGNSSTGAIGVVSGAALTLTGGAASTLSTTTGALTLQGGSGVTIATPNAGTSSAITIQTGNSTSGTAASVNVDTGTSTSGTSAINLGVTNAGSVVIGKSTTTTTVQGNFTAGASAGTGTFTNNGSTKNTSLALGDLAAGAIGTAANTVDKYTSFTIAPTASGRTYTIPAPTDGTAGRIIYISNIHATSTFIIGSTTFNAHSTATLVYDGTSWNFAGMDGGSNNYIQNQTAATQTAGFNINGTGTANLLQAATFDTASNIALNVGTSNATQINLNKNIQVAANQSLTFAAGSGNFDMHNSTGTLQTGTGAVSLNGDTTIATGKNFTVTNGTSNVTGATNINTTGSSTTSIGNVSATNTIAGTTGITGATSINTSGSANTNIGNGSTGTVTVGDASTGAVSIQSGTSIGVTGNTTVTGTTNVNTTGSSATSLGNTTTGGAVNIASNTAINLQAAASGSITLGSQAAANTLNIGTVGTAAFSSTVNIGTSSGAAQTVTVGSAASSSALTLQSGSGILALQSQGTINIGTNAVAQTVTIGNNTGATSVSVDCGTGNCNFGTTATSHTTNLGSTSGSSTTNVQGGTGGITINTAGTVRATFNNSNAVYFGNGVTAAAPNSFTISGTGSSTTAVAGGALTVQGGNATVGNANGGNVTISGGTGIGTGTANGLVVLTTPTFQTVTNDANCYTSGALVAGTTNGAGAGIDGCTMAATSVNNSSAILVGFNTSGKTAAMPSPTIATAGRVVYVTAANGTTDFTLSVNGGGTGNTIAMRQNTTATMIWNGSAWTAAGASSSTTMQSAYDNTLQSAGGAELVVSHTSNTNGLTIRDSSTSPVNGTLLSVQSSSAANLFSVNSNVTEYASNAGAESYSGTTTAFPASTWSALTGATVTRNVTTANIATGQGSAQAATTTTAGSGIKNQLSTTLTAGQHYNVSFSTKLSSGTFTDMGVYYSIDGTADSVTCTTNQAVKTSVWTKVNCTFTAPSSGITSSNSINIRQIGSGTSRTFYVDNISVTIAADYNYATDGGVNNSGTFATNWTVVGTGSVSRNTSDGQEASDSAQALAGTTANNGIKNKLSINPLTSTLYRVSVYAKLSAGSAFTDFKVRYTPDNGSTFVDCVDYNGQTVTTTAWTQITCYINTASTTVTNPSVQFIQPTAPGSSRTFLVDAFSMTLASNSTPNVQIGGSSNGGPTTLFTLDRGASAPIAANNDALLGSMYYDTTLGKLQCYEADGWGACGSSPDNIVTISPEYTNAVLHGTGVGTMTSDLCSDTLNINDGSSGQDTICGSNETYNFYKWTSPQTTSQTYSIYVTYQLPSTFKAFQSGATSIMGRTDNGSSGGTATVSYQVYRNNSTTGLSPCGSSVSVSTGTVSSWQTGTASGAADPSTCGFAPSDSVVFKIDAVTNKNASAYMGNLNFTFSNR